MLALGSSPGAASVSYDTTMFQWVSPVTVEQITSALGLHRSSKRQGHRPNVAEVPRPSFLSHPDLRRKQAREDLKLVLIAVAKWNGALGYSESFAGFCAMVLAMEKSKRKAFSTAVRVYKRYELEEYYQAADPGQPSVGAATEDANAVWEELHYLAPEVTQAFSKHDEEHLFVSVVRDWLLSLFTAGFAAQADETALGCTPLLDRIIRAEPAGWEHPRTLLRHIAACILMRSSEDLRRASASSQGLRAAALALRTGIRVDQALLDLIDLGPSRGRLQALQVAAALPGAGAAGWLLGAALLPGAAAAGGLLGSAAGGALAVGWGMQSGSESFQRIMQHLANDAGVQEEPPQ